MADNERDVRQLSDDAETQPTIDDPSDVLTVVLPDAIRRTSAEIAGHDTQGSLTPSEIRNSWIRCLRDAFYTFYKMQPGTQHIAVFGGTPRKGEPVSGGVPSGIPHWSRWEFLHDVAVVEWELISAAYAKDKNNYLEPQPLPIVTRAIWQVESEIAGDGTAVAEDASKLRICKAENKLLVVSFAQQKNQQPWLDFLASTMSKTDGNRFIALVPNYKNIHGYEQWRQQSVSFHLYRCGANIDEVHLLL